jgi:hypothetical protein
MTPDHSRRNFLRYVPGALFVLTAAQTTSAQRPGQGSSINPGSGNPVDAQPSTSHGGLGGGGGVGGQTPPPGPAQKNGDYQPPTLEGPHDKSKDKDPAPHKPRKDLAADQKTLRDEVQRLALDTQELNNAVAQFGPRQALSVELVGKTKEIEKLARDIAALAKG